MNCKSCKYYVQHYMMHRKLGLMEVGCGHCVHMQIKTCKRKGNCEFFEQGESEVGENLKSLSILKSIERTKLTCSYIAKVLQDLRKDVKDLN